MHERIRRQRAKERQNDQQRHEPRDSRLVAGFVAREALCDETAKAARNQKNEENYGERVTRMAEENHKPLHLRKLDENESGADRREKSQKRKGAAHGALLSREEQRQQNT